MTATTRGTALDSGLRRNDSNDKGNYSGNYATLDR
jgi:hypothetical protein